MNLTVLLVIAAVAFVAWTLWRARPQVKPDELRAALQAGTAVLIDVAVKNAPMAAWAGRMPMRESGITTMIRNGVR